MRPSTNTSRSGGVRVRSICPTRIPSMVCGGRARSNVSSPASRQSRKSPTVAGSAPRRLAMCSSSSVRFAQTCSCSPRCSRLPADSACVQPRQQLGTNAKCFEKFDQLGDELGDRLPWRCESQKWRELGKQRLANGVDSSGRIVARRRVAGQMSAELPRLG